MEKRILLEKRGRDANQIKELNLDNCRSTSIEGLTDDFSSLEKLSLINVGLTSLKSFPKLPSLKKLELSDNRISSGLNHLTSSDKLTSLNLSGNKIKEFEELKPLASLEKLEILDLFNNEVTQAENYRSNVFQLIPSLRFLDGFDSSDNEAPSDDEDEANGNDSDDDDDFPDIFCGNGIEINLRELEELERRVKSKREKTSSTSKTPETENETENDCDKLVQKFDNSLTLKEAPQPSLATVTLVMFSIFFLLNQIFYKPTAQTDDDELEEDEEESDDEDDEDDDGPGLKDVYNDALDDEEDSGQEWNQVGEEEDDDIDSDEEADETAEKVESFAEGDGASEESPTRGKKRKHEGD